MRAEQYVVYDWIRLYAHCGTTRRNSLSAILRNADKGVFKLVLDSAICPSDSFEFTRLKAFHESASLNRIAADKSDSVIVVLDDYTTVLVVICPLFHN